MQNPVIKERPILFSTEMVQAILQGRKTQTRRVLKEFFPIRLDKEENYAHTDKFVGTYASAINKCKYGKKGDRLWVRETFAEITGGHGWWYKSENSHLLNVKWKPSIFMPRAASRITLEITNVRCEQLHDITDNDAIQEGVEEIKTPSGSHNGFRDYLEKSLTNPTAKNSYQTLWQKINGPDSWDQNPYVWVIEFKVITL